MLVYPVTTCMGNSCSRGCRWWWLWWCLFVLSVFPRDVLGEIWVLIESVSEGFPTYSFIDVVDSLIIRIPRAISSHKSIMRIANISKNYLIGHRYKLDPIICSYRYLPVNYISFCSLMSVSWWQCIKYDCCSLIINYLKVQYQLWSRLCIQMLMSSAGQQEVWHL